MGNTASHVISWNKLHSALAVYTGILVPLTASLPVCIGKIRAQVNTVGRVVNCTKMAIHTAGRGA